MADPKSDPVEPATPPDDDAIAVALALVTSYSSFTVAANIASIGAAVSVTVDLARVLELAGAGLRETVGNKVNSLAHTDKKLDKPKAAKACATAIQDGSYTFGAGGRSSDPVSKREHEIAVERVKTSIRAAGKKMGDYDVDALADRHAESHPEIRDQAVKDVAATKALAGAVDLTPVAETETDES